MKMISPPPLWHIAHLRQQSHNSKSLIFSGEAFKGFWSAKFFVWVQRRHNCSPAASFANCVMALYLFQSAPANVSFYTSNSKVPDSELWLLSQMSDLSVRYVTYCVTRCLGSRPQAVNFSLCRNQHYDGCISSGTCSRFPREMHRFV